MKQRQFKQASSLSRRIKKIGLGAGGLAALGLTTIIGPTQPSTADKSKVFDEMFNINVGVKPLNAQEFLKGYDTTLDAREAAALKQPAVKQALNTMRTWSANEKMAFLESPEEFLDDLGIDAADQAAISALHKRMTGEILRRLQVARYSPH